LYIKAEIIYFWKNAGNEWLLMSFANLTKQLFTEDMELGMQVKGTIPSRVE
jgi:hypothetical protein